VTRCWLACFRLTGRSTCRHRSLNMAAGEVPESVAQPAHFAVELTHTQTHVTAGRFVLESFESVSRHSVHRCT